jgi:hypothetical protein
VTLTGATPTKTSEQAGAADGARLFTLGGTTAGCLAVGSAALRPSVGGEIDEVWEFAFNSEVTTAVVRQLAALPAKRTQAAAAPLPAVVAQAAASSAAGHPQVLLFGGKDAAGQRVADTLLYSTGAYTWAGAADSDWRTTTNWTPAGAPIYGNDVIIPAGAPRWPVVAAAATCHDLTIASAAALTVSQGITLTATGVVSNSGRLTQVRAADAAGAGVAFGLWGNASALTYAGVTITPTVAALGTVTVTVRGAVCGAGGALPQTVERCFEITPANPGPATVRFYYHAAEANGNADPTVYRWDGAAWQALSTTDRSNTGDGWRWVEAAVTSYSAFALKDGPDAPTAVVLRGLTAARGGTPVALAIGLAALVLDGAWIVARRRRGQ